MTSKKDKQEVFVNAKSEKDGEPIRVLHYIGSLNIGGSQTMIMNIYRNIDRKKIQFDFVIDRKNEKHFVKEIKSLGGKVYVFDEYFNGKNYFKFRKQWVSFFKSHPEYRIIHCHVRSVASIVLKIAKKNGLKTICHSHSISNGIGIKSLAKNFLQKGIVKYSDLLLACSKEAAIWLFGEEAANNKNCIIVNNAIDPNKYRFNKGDRDRVRKEYGVGENDVLIGHVGRFSDEKNHKFMIDLMDSINQPGYKLIFCGDGKTKEAIKHAAMHNKNILFYDDIYNASDLYSALDVFILPSKYEGLGLVLIEAQFNGLECIASENVPKSVVISDRIKFLSLNKEQWKDVLCSARVRDERISRLIPSAQNYLTKSVIAVWKKLYCDIEGA